jgi:hypothetical protein
MAVYAPGTLFRIFNADKSQHHSAVLLIDGHVYETKNSDGQPKCKYASLDAWRAARQPEGGSFLADATKAKGVVINPEENGFKYPTTSDLNLRYVVWAYRMMKQYAPSLLSREDVKTAYNHLVDVCTSWKPNMIVRVSLGSTDPDYLDFRTPRLWYRTPFRFVYNTPPATQKIVLDAQAAWRDLVYADLMPHLTYENRRKSALADLQKQRRALKNLETKAANIREQIKYTTRVLTSLESPPTTGHTGSQSGPETTE